MNKKNFKQGGEEWRLSRSKAHLPGADKEWNVELEIDGEEKEVNI